MRENEGVRERERELCVRERGDRLEKRRLTGTLFRKHVLFRRGWATFIAQHVTLGHPLKNIEGGDIYPYFIYSPL